MGACCARIGASVLGSSPSELYQRHARLKPKEVAIYIEAAHLRSSQSVGVASRPRGTRARDPVLQSNATYSGEARTMTQTARKRPFGTAPGSGGPSASGRERWSALLGVLFATALAIFTTHKLYRMAWIRGIVGDAQVQRRPVAGKTHHPGRRREICLFVLRDNRAAGRPRRNIEADCDYWEQKQIGDLIDLVDTGHGHLYLREGGIFTSVGCFIVDFVLLAAELTAVIHCVRRLRRRTTESAEAS